MRNGLKQLLLASAFASLALVTGCGKGDNPVAPATPAPEYLDVTVRLVRLLAVADGDGIEGAGDFTFEAVVSDGQPGALTSSGQVTLDSGNTHERLTHARTHGTRARAERHPNATRLAPTREARRAGGQAGENQSRRPIS